MQKLEVDNYIPPFITETDELRWDDCTVCATLMGVASATLGEAVSNKNWDQLTRSEIKVLRERIRNYLGSDNQTGGTTMADMRVAFAKEYPWLPEIPSYEEQRLGWGVARQRLLNGFGGVYMGNPSLVTNPNSKLRRWTNNDNFGHAIWVDRARKNAEQVEFYVMDPLGRGDYDGEWVPENELEEFTWTYNASDNSRYITVFERGDWSILAENKAKLLREIDDLNAEIEDLSKKLDIANRLIEDAKKERNAALILRDAALSRANAAEAQVIKLKKNIAELNVTINRLRNKLLRCK